MAEIKYKFEKEYKINADVLRNLSDQELINDGNYRTVICFFEHRLNENFCFVREIDVDCQSRSEERKQEVINRIESLDNTEETRQSLMYYLERINGKLKTSSVRSGNIEYYFIHCVPVLSQSPRQI
jgi:hypothetical protein